MTTFNNVGGLQGNYQDFAQQNISQRSHEFEASNDGARPTPQVGKPKTAWQKFKAFCGGNDVKIRTGTNVTRNRKDTRLGKMGLGIKRMASSIKHGFKKHMNPNSHHSSMRLTAVRDLRHAELAHNKLTDKMISNMASGKVGKFDTPFQLSKLGQLADNATVAQNEALRNRTALDRNTGEFASTVELIDKYRAAGAGIEDHIDVTGGVGKTKQSDIIEANIRDGIKAGLATPEGRSNMLSGIGDMFSTRVVDGTAERGKTMFENAIRQTALELAKAGNTKDAAALALAIANQDPASDDAVKKSAELMQSVVDRSPDGDAGIKAAVKEAVRGDGGTGAKQVITKMALDAFSYSPTSNTGIDMDKASFTMPFLNDVVSHGNGMDDADTIAIKARISEQLLKLDGDQLTELFTDADPEDLNELSKMLLNKKGLEGFEKGLQELIDNEDTSDDVRQDVRTNRSILHALQNKMIGNLTNDPDTLMKLVMVPENDKLDSQVAGSHSRTFMVNEQNRNLDAIDFTKKLVADVLRKYNIDDAQLDELSALKDKVQWGQEENDLLNTVLGDNRYARVDVLKALGTQAAIIDAAKKGFSQNDQQFTDALNDLGIVQGHDSIREALDVRFQQRMGAIDDMGLVNGVVQQLFDKHDQLDEDISSFKALFTGNHDQGEIDSVIDDIVGWDPDAKRDMQKAVEGYAELKKLLRNTAPDADAIKSALNKMGVSSETLREDVIDAATSELKAPSNTKHDTLIVTHWNAVLKSAVREMVTDPNKSDQEVVEFANEIMKREVARQIDAGSLFRDSTDVTPFVLGALIERFGEDEFGKQLGQEMVDLTAQTMSKFLDDDAYKPENIDWDADAENLTLPVLRGTKRNGVVHPEVLLESTKACYDRLKDCNVSDNLKAVSNMVQDKFATPPHPDHPNQVSLGRDAGKDYMLDSLFLRDTNSTFALASRTNAVSSQDKGLMDTMVQTSQAVQSGVNFSDTTLGKWPGKIDVATKDYMIALEAEYKKTHNNEDMPSEMRDKFEMKVRAEFDKTLDLIKEQNTPQGVIKPLRDNLQSNVGFSIDDNLVDNNREQLSWNAVSGRLDEAQVDWQKDIRNEVISAHQQIFNIGREQPSDWLMTNDNRPSGEFNNFVAKFPDGALNKSQEMELMKNLLRSDNLTQQDLQRADIVPVNADLNIYQVKLPDAQGPDNQGLPRSILITPSAMTFNLQENGLHNHIAMIE
ncbi:MAG: hypothetical protein AAGC81_04845 [Pseudomonadota bacterium]